MNTNLFLKQWANNVLNLQEDKSRYFEILCLLLLKGLPEVWNSSGCLCSDIFTSFNEIILIKFSLFTSNTKNSVSLIKKDSYRSRYCPNLSSIELLSFVTVLLCLNCNNSKVGGGSTHLMLPCYLLSASFVSPAFFFQKQARLIKTQFQLN